MVQGSNVDRKSHGMEILQEGDELVDGVVGRRFMQEVQRGSSLGFEAAWSGSS